MPVKAWATGASLTASTVIVAVAGALAALKLSNARKVKVTGVFVSTSAGGS